MKVQYRISGQYRRLQVTGSSSTLISIVDLIKEVQAIATQNHLRSLPRLHKSFALDFLPKPILVNLLQQAQGVNCEDELYQLSSLELLHNAQSSFLSKQSNTYSYQFICSDFTLNLSPDDPQIPIWTSNEETKVATYTLTLESPHHPQINSDFIRNIWQQGVEHWQTLSDLQKMHTALTSVEHNLFCFINKHNLQLQIWLNLQDLPTEMRLAVSFLHLSNGDCSLLPEASQNLIKQYQAQYDIALQTSTFPSFFSQNPTLSKQTTVISRQTRSQIKEIISNAQQFLLVSSYIIEDEELVELICQQTEKLPQGIWILTDIRNEIIDRIDIRLAKSIKTPEEYQRADARKKACLRRLLNSKVRIRSGAFHLKTYISEQSAYLGSCNLTKGSLDFNLEAGVIFQNNPTHNHLIDLFRHFWQQRSRDEVIPMINCDGFRLHSIDYYSSEASQIYPALLNPLQYKEDLLNELIGFTGSIYIYSRSFFPDAKFEQLLKLLDTHVYVESQFSKIPSQFDLKAINKLHAKVTLLNNKVAYIGGVNFNFNPSTYSLMDLMYKTRDPQQIDQIRQKLISLQ